MPFAEVLPLQKVGNDQDVLTYEIPPELNIKIGQAAKVPLRNKTIIALVWNIVETKPTFKTRSLLGILYETPLLTSAQIELIKWISQYHFCPLYKVLKLFIPKRILSEKPIREKKSPKKIIEKFSDKTLTEEQIKVIDFILKSPQKNKTNSFLISGITGSGKTEIYTRLTDYYLKNNHQVLILVPEISLTPQIIEYFEKSLGKEATVIHSKLSEGERITAWQKIHENKSKLVIGSRSAIFAPFKDLQLIIVDEEHDPSYKQDSSPRYRIHSIIEKLQSFSPQLKAVFGSATPSIETAEKLKDTTINLNLRIGKSTLPEIEIIDLREEFKKNNHSIFSERLQEEMRNTLSNKGQILLFLNRRGSATCITCRDCGYTYCCKHCEMPMTYHQSTLSKPKLICHHCGKIENPPDICPNCQGSHIRYLGIGTQKIEEEVLKEFPQAKILRADRDTTSTKYGFEKIYTDFRNHKADVLIGTQMIAKGLHLPKVSLVGIVLADIGLNIPDFRTLERNFQLLLQVSGRAGRSETKGKVIIQTYDPQNAVLKYVKEQNYENFRIFETLERKTLANPPFGNLCKIIVHGKSAEQSRKTAERIENLLHQNSVKLEISDQIEINIYPAYILKLYNHYRYIVLLKSRDRKISLHKLLEKLPKEDIMNPDIKIDIDPITIT